MKDSHQDFGYANDPDISVDALAELVASNDELVRGAVALNNATPDYLLQKLFFDKSAHVQDCLQKRLKQH
jgi:hypothetical protein